jgi:site-specific recombinase XerD
MHACRKDTAHVFVTTQNTPLTHGSGVYHALIRCCDAANINTRTSDSEGREVDHVDVHSLRRTFATDLIENGADPKTVQRLLGHSTLAMTMDLYAKIRTGTTRQAVGRLSYGSGAQAPGHVVEFPAVEVESCHKIPTVDEPRRTAST